MNRHEFFLDLAADVAAESRRHGAVGIRRDGAIVVARNGTAAQHPCPPGHAEVRLLRKLGRGGVVYTARWSPTGRWANGKPCPRCEAAMRAKGVRRCYYTISEDAFGVLDFHR